MQRKLSNNIICFLLSLLLFGMCIGGVRVDSLFDCNSFTSKSVSITGDTIVSSDVYPEVSFARPSAISQIRQAGRRVTDRVGRNSVLHLSFVGALPQISQFVSSAGTAEPTTLACSHVVLMRYIHSKDGKKS